MKIIIIGATIVGIELAEYLVQAGHAVTLIDQPSEQLTQIANRLDLRVVQGDPTWPSVLKEAGAHNTELIVATAPSDEINITACSVAAHLFGIPRKIARLRAPDFLNQDQLFGPKGIPIDHLISPEHLMAQAIEDLLSLPGVSSMSSFGDERIAICAVTCKAGGKGIDKYVQDIETPDNKCAVLAVYRDGKQLTKLEDCVLQVNDEVFFCAERSRALNLLANFTPLRTIGKNVVIAGGNHIADSIAQRLSERYHVKLIEPDTKRAARLAQRFQDSPIELYCADASNLDFILEEKLYQTDTFIAAASSEESNIMSTMMLQRINKDLRTIAILRQTALQEVTNDSSDVDVIVSPREIIVSGLLSDIRQEGVLKMRVFKQGQAEAIEVVVQGSKRASRALNSTVDDLNLPSNIVRFGLVLRDKKILQIDEQFVFEEGDRVVIFLTDRSYMRPVINKFKPRPFWIPKW